MARGSYQYETSPRKIEPEYTLQKKEPKKIKSKKNKKQEMEQKMKELKQKKRMYHKKIVVIMGVFLVFLAISYRNSLITERFNEIQEKKKELAFIEKSNGQMEVSIEGSLNLKNVEQSAEEKLGMKKLQNEQKVYVTLPKQDYTEKATEEITEGENTNWFMELINSIFK